MHKFTRIIALAAACTVPVIGFAAAPAGAKTVSPQQWAPKFCTALSDWQSSLDGSSSNLSSALSGTTDLQLGKTTLVDFLSQAIDSTDTAIGDLKAAGTPDTPNGAKIQAGLLKGFSEAKQVFAEAEASAEQLSTTNATTFATQATTIGNQISASSGKIESAFGKLDKLDKGGALQKVVKKTRACKFLGS